MKTGSKIGLERFLSTSMLVLLGVAALVDVQPVARRQLTPRVPLT
ncbi:hypothetical protein [Variovorax sp. JS1663]|nr:hypothetical protein [Variovorax sp. JS1663]